MGIYFLIYNERWIRNKDLEISESNRPVFYEYTGVSGGIVNILGGGSMGFSE